MAVVGEAYVVVRAMTDKVSSDIQKGMNSSSARSGARRAGESLSDSFSRGFNRNLNANVFNRLSQGLRTMVPGADAARNAFLGLAKAGQLVGAALPALLGGISSVIGGIGALAGAAGGAIPALVALGNVIFALGAGMAAVKLATGGIGKAVSALNKGSSGGGGGGGSSGGGGSAAPDNSAAILAANRRVRDAEEALASVIERNREDLVDANNDVRKSQIALNKAFEEGREEIQQLGFDAEDAALAEKEAAIELSRARDNLLAVQDLAPNSRARQQAQLEFEQAELAYRQAKDKSADLNKEQARLARTGVAGTQTVIDATNDLADATADKDKTVRDGLRDQKDAEEDLADAIADRADAAKTAATAGAGGGGGGGGGGADIFEGLNDAQIKFAKFIASLKPKFDELSRIASESFLPKLQTAIETLMDKAYPVVAVGIGQVASAMGNAAISLANAITSASNLNKLASLFTTSAPLLESMGRVLGSVWGIFLSLLQAAAPQAQRFFNFLEEKLGAFDAWLDKIGTGEGNQLTKFFETSGDMLAQFGRIFGNIFGGFGAIIRANFGPGTGGAMVLDWLETATASFRDLDSTAGKSEGLVKYFRETAVNTEKVMSSIGALLAAFLRLGADPAIGKTFDVLKSGVPYLEQLGKLGVAAGPALAELVVAILKMTTLLADTGTMKAFFDTLTAAVEGVTVLLENDFVRALLAVLAPISGILLAFNTIYKTGAFVFRALTGTIIGIASSLGALGGSGTAAATGIEAAGTAAAVAGTKVGGFRGALGSAASFLTGPWGIAIAAGIAAGLGIKTLIESTQTSTEDLTKALSDGGDAVHALALAGKNVDFRNFKDADVTINGVKDSLQNAANISKDFWSGFRTDASALGATQESLKKYGDSLAEIATTDLPAAQAQFANLSREYQLSNTEQFRLINVMPAYLKSVQDQVAAQGINIESLDKVSQKTAIVKTAIGEAIVQSGDHILSLGTTTTAIEAQNTAYDNLANAISGFGSTQMSANAATREYQVSSETVTASVAAQRQAYLDANGTLDGFRADLTASTPEGRENQAMFEDLAKKTLESAAATFENTGNVQDSTQAIADGRQKLIEQATQLGLTSDEANAYADELGLIPGDVTTNLHLNGYAAVYRDLMTTQALLRSLANDYSIHVSTGPGGQGGITKANGGIVEAYAAGGMRNSGRTRMSQIASGFKAAGGILWGEPETGWEAYISGKSGQEDRNRGILNETARRLNMVPNTGGTQIQITVQPAPGMNEMELTQMISRELAYQMRMGGV